MRHARADGKEFGRDRDADLAAGGIAGDDRPGHLKLYTSSQKSLPSGRVALHAPWIGGGTAAAAQFGSGGEAALRPVGPDLDDMAAALQRIDSGLRHAIFEHQHA